MKLLSFQCCQLIEALVHSTIVCQCSLFHFHPVFDDLVTVSLLCLFRHNQNIKTSVLCVCQSYLRYPVFPEQPLPLLVPNQTLASPLKPSRHLMIKHGFLPAEALGPLKALRVTSAESVPNQSVASPLESSGQPMAGRAGPVGIVSAIGSEVG